MRVHFHTAPLESPYIRDTGKCSPIFRLSPARSGGHHASRSRSLKSNSTVDIGQLRAEFDQEESKAIIQTIPAVGYAYPARCLARDMPIGPNYLLDALRNEVRLKLPTNFR